MKRRTKGPKVVRATEADELAALAYLNARDTVAIAERALAEARARLEASLGGADELQGSVWHARRAPTLVVVETPALAIRCRARATRRTM